MHHSLNLTFGRYWLGAIPFTAESLKAYKQFYTESEMAGAELFVGKPLGIPIKVIYYRLHETVNKRVLPALIMKLKLF